MKSRHLFIRLVYASVFGLNSIFVSAISGNENWPMWRYDSYRSAASPNTAPSELELLWKLSLPERQPVWDDPLNQDLMPYDSNFEPVVLDGRMFIGFNDQDKLVAVDTESGEVLWTFFADAPFRLPPAGWRNRILACSDDGFLYCIDVETGRLVWSFRGGPNSQLALGNRRLTSAWPARGGPVVREETVYFAASIWPFMGTFIYALDVETGRIQWVNDSTGAQYIKQPHSAPSFAGVGPQGALVATEDHLIVPGGRSVPAVFSRSDGQFQHFEINAGGKGTGGSFVAADSVHFYVHTREKGTRAFNIETGLKTAFQPNEPVILGDVLFAASQSNGRQQIEAFPAGLDDDKNRDSLWTFDAPSTDDLIAAGQHLVAAGLLETGQSRVSLIRMPKLENGTFSGGEITRQIDLPDHILRVLVADKKIFAVAKSGAIYALGSPPTGASTQSLDSQALGADHLPSVTSSLTAGEFASVAGGLSDAESQQNQQLPPQRREEPDGQRSGLIARLLGTGDSEGYAIWFGPCNVDLLTAWAEANPFVQLAIVDGDAQRVDQSRRHLDSLGTYGKITVHASTPREFRAPHYVANQIFVSPELIAEATDDDLSRIYSSVRPFGGSLTILCGQASTTELSNRIASLGWDQAEIQQESELVLVRRVGALPGSADWTHQHGDIANSVKSNDSSVQLPLGILWFGGNSNMDILPRHGHGPPQQVVAGRLIIQGMNSLSARDVYTGRILWHRDFGDLGTFEVYFDSTYDDAPLDPKYNQVHIPGANARGTNYVVTEDRIYLAIGNQCKILDAATGEDLGEISLPKDEDGDDPEWGFIGIYQNVLLGGVGFAKYRQRLDLDFESDKLFTGNKAGFSSKSLDRAASRALIGYDRFSGQMLWQVAATHSFWHNGIVAGGGKVYCLDRNPALVEEALRRRGVANPDTYRILAIDSQTGDEIWEVREKIFGTWLGYSEPHDLLLQAGARGSDRLADEVGKGMMVYNASDGSLRWAHEDLAYSGPCILHNDWIITNTNSYSISAGAYHILTGSQRMIKNPITGQLQPWQMTRAYGCNKIIASENLLTFRSGAAGYYDLSTDSGTGNWGGFKSGCTSNLIVANGVLNAPDYTRTCSCSYQNQTSLALVHMPELDQWSINLSAVQAEKGAEVETVGINFGAPGDRRDSEGILWIEHPCVAGDSPPLQISLNDDAQFYAQHSSTFSTAPLPWVQASGVIGVSKLRIGLRTQETDSAGEDNPKSESPVEETPIDFTDEIPSNPRPEETISYDIDLYFGLPNFLTTDEEHVFDVRLAEHDFCETITLSSRLNDAALDNDLNYNPASTHAKCSFHDVPLGDELVVIFDAKQGSPVISGIRVVRARSKSE